MSKIADAGKTVAKDPATKAALGALVILVLAGLGAVYGGFFETGCKLNEACSIKMGEYKQNMMPVAAGSTSATTVVIDGKPAPVVEVPVSSTVGLTTVSDTVSPSGL